MKQVFRRQKRLTLESRLVGHTAGRTRPTTALTREGVEPIERLNPDGRLITAEEEKGQYAAALKELRRLRANPLPGRPAQPVMDLFFGGLPPFGDRADWEQWVPGAADLPREQLNQRQAAVARVYFGECVRWVSKCAGPTSRIAVADVHLDEASPHLQILLVAANGEGRLGWNSVAKGFVGAGAPGLNHPRFMSAVQDRFHDQVASHYGLERGSTTSTGTGESINRTMGAAARLAEEEQEARRALQALEQREAELVLEGAARDRLTAYDELERGAPAKLSALVADARKHGLPRDLANLVRDNNTVADEDFAAMHVDLVAAQKRAEELEAAEKRAVAAEQPNALTGKPLLVQLYLRLRERAQRLEGDLTQTSHTLELTQDALVREREGRENDRLADDRRGQDPAQPTRAQVDDLRKELASETKARKAAATAAADAATKIKNLDQAAAERLTVAEGERLAQARKDWAQERADERTAATTARDTERNAEAAKLTAARAGETKEREARQKAEQARAAAAAQVAKLTKQLDDAGTKFTKLETENTRLRKAHLDAAPAVPKRPARHDSITPSQSGPSLVDLEL